MSESNSHPPSSNVSKKSRIPVVAIEGFQLQGKSPLQEDVLEINLPKGIFALADGFGGASGREAANHAVKGVKRFLEQEAGDLDATLPFEIRPYFTLAGNVLFNAFAFANRQVNESNRTAATHQQPGGASLLAGYLEGQLLSLANVGCCSVVLHRDGVSKEMIVPRSWGRQVNPFGEDHVASQIPLMSLGTVKSLEPEVIEVKILPGDQVLLQTSSVPELFRKEIFRLKEPKAVKGWLDLLEAEVQEQGAISERNMSVIWIKF